MKKYIKSVLFCFFCLMLAFACFVPNNFAVSTKTNISFAENESSENESVSIFIRKPAYSVFYNDKLFFIDETDKLLKIYDSANHVFDSKYLDLSAYEIIDTSFIENALFLMVKTSTENKLLKINLDTLQVEKTYDFSIESGYESCFVQKIIFDETPYFLATFSVRGRNAKIAIINETTDSIIDFQMQFKSDDSLQNTVKSNLKKVISYQDSSSRLYIVFVYNNNGIAYYSINSYSALTELETKEVLSLGHTEIPQNESTNSNITDVGLMKIDSKDYLAISFPLAAPNEVINLYSFAFDSGTETISYSAQFSCLNSRFTLFNNDYYSYVDIENQKLFFTKISSETTLEGTNFSETTTEVDNPNYNISYLSVDEFIYKSANKLTELYEDPWGANSAIIVGENVDVIKIGSAVLENNTIIQDYDYCLFTNNNYNYCGFIRSEDLKEKTQISVSEAGFKARVSVWPNAVLYSLPTTVIRGQIGTDGCPLLSKRLLQIEDNSELEVLNVLCGYSANGTKMLKVRVNGKDVGYIEERCVRTPANVVDFVITNATIKKDNTTVYLSASTDATALTFKLNKGKNIRINGKRDTKTGFTSITFNDEYGNEFTGYIETDYLKADAWSTLQIVGCVLIAINIGLLILILLYKKNHLGSRGQKISDSATPLNED